MNQAVQLYHQYKNNIAVYIHIYYNISQSAYTKNVI